MYRTLPVREEVLRAVLGADLIGFHTYDYARHFISSCTRILGLEVCVCVCVLGYMHVFCDLRSVLVHALVAVHVRVLGACACMYAHLYALVCKTPWVSLLL